MDRLDTAITLGDEELKTIIGGDEQIGGPPVEPQYIQKIPVIDGWKG